MSELTWRHGLAASEAKAMVIKELEALGHQDKAEWDGNEVTASLGFGLILDLAASVEDETLRVDRCTGAISAVVLSKCRDLLEKAFPGGEVSGAAKAQQM